MKLVISLLALGSALLVLSCATTLHAQVPQLVNYQGRVAVGAVNFDGSGSFKFALVNTDGSITDWSNDGTSTGGSEPTAAVSLTVTKGLYSVLLGDTTLTNMTAIPSSVWANADVRLRVWFNDGVNGFQLLRPDQRLAPNGYLPDGSVSSAKIAPAAVTSTQLAANSVQAGNLAPGAVGSAQLAPNISIPGSITAGTIAGNGSGLIGLGAAQVVFASGASGATPATLSAILGRAPLNLATDFKADPTGKTDSTAQIQAWFTAGCTQHRPLYAEPGTYLFSSPITMAYGTPGDGNTFGDGFVMRGAGPKETVFETSLDIDGFVFPHAVQDMILDGFGVVCARTDSTHAGIRADGTRAEDGGDGGASMNGFLWSNLEIAQFGTGMNLYYFSNSRVLNCSIGNCGTGVLLSGSSNSVAFDTCTTTSAISYGYRLSGGQSVTVSCADITTTTGGTAIGLEDDGVVALNVQNVRCENRGSGYPAEVAAGMSVAFHGCLFLNFGGTAPYGLHNSGQVNSTISGFAGTVGSIRQDDGGTCVVDNNYTTIDNFSVGSKVDSFPGQRIIGDTTLLDGFSFQLRGYSRGSGSSLYGGALIFNGNNISSNIAVGYPYNYISGDWGIYNSSGPGTVGLSGQAGTAQPNMPIFYIDSVNNHTSIGHRTANQPTGTATLNVEGSLSATGIFHLTPQATPSAATEGDIYVSSTDHHTYEFNGSAWKQLDN